MKTVFRKIRQGRFSDCKFPLSGSNQGGEIAGDHGAQF